jgi:hypothetical protein
LTLSGFTRARLRIAPPDAWKAVIPRHAQDRFDAPEQAPEDLIAFD